MEPIYLEEQRFRQPWLWGVLGGSALLTAALLGWGAFVQLVLGQPWGNRPMPDGMLVVTLAIIAVVYGGLLWLCWAACLRTEVWQDHLSVRFYPFHSTPKEIPFASIRRWEVVRYSPLRDYGGWGVRYGAKGMAYNVSGDRGLQLELAGGDQLLIGTQRPDDLDLSLNVVASEKG